MMAGRAGSINRAGLTDSACSAVGDEAAQVLGDRLRRPRPGPHAEGTGRPVCRLVDRRRPARAPQQTQIHGGGHERGMRSGTLPTHQIVGMGEAYRIARLEMAKDNAHALALRNRLLEGLSAIPETYVNGSLEHRVAQNLNMSFNYVEGESLIMAIKEIAVSSGSACTSASLEPSYVLRALGRNDELAHSSIRFTMGRFTTEQEIDFTVELLKSQIGKLRDMSPLWEMVQEGIDLNSVKWAAH